MEVLNTFANFLPPAPGKGDLQLPGQCSGEGRQGRVPSKDLLGLFSHPPLCQPPVPGSGVIFKL